MIILRDWFTSILSDMEIYPKRVETMTDFWNLKVPCWDFLGCPENIHAHCSAYHNKGKSCWEQEAATQCRNMLDFEWECADCKVFAFYALPKTSTVSSRKPNNVNDLFPKISL
jgi:hypothetical protein